MGLCNGLKLVVCFQSNLVRKFTHKAPLSPKPQQLLCAMKDQVK